MSLLDQVIKGKQEKPLNILIYGPDGSGKTTLAAGAPAPIFLEAEEGSANLNVDRFPRITSFTQLEKYIEFLTNEKHSYQTVVLDSLDWFEQLLWKRIAEAEGAKSLAKISYGKGYEIAVEQWHAFKGKLEALQAKTKMNLIMIAHAVHERFSDPQQQQEYDRYQLKLHKKAAPLFREYPELVIFLNAETVTRSEENGKVRAFSDGTRIAYTEGKPGFVAKSRLDLPAEIPISKETPWKDLMKAIADAKGSERQTPVESPEVLKNKISVLLTKVKDEKIIGAVKSELEKSPSPEKLLKIQNKLQTLTSATT